jgi:hypothetical protein
MMKYFLLLFMLEWSKIQVTTAFAAPRPRRLEAAAIKRFREFDKLCKTCPTTLKPRVETLTEMILGLSDAERKELWNAVARRLEEQEDVGGVQTPEDVFKFQTGVDAATTPKPEKSEPSRKDMTPKVRETPLPTEKDTEEKESKLLRKMNKTRSKLQDSKCKQARIQRLLDQTDSLLSNNTTLSSNGCDETDSAVYHSLDELKQMNPTELKYQRLKYMAQKSKLDQKIATYRLKLYGASLELANAAEQTKQEVALIVNE